jgi:hypothetical protein
MFRVRLKPYPNPCTRSHSSPQQDRRRVRGTPQHVGYVGIAAPDVVVMVGADRRTSGDTGSHIGLSRASTSQEGARTEGGLAWPGAPTRGSTTEGTVESLTPSLVEQLIQSLVLGISLASRVLNVGRASVGRRVTISPGPAGAIQRPMMASLHRKCTSVDRPLHEH